MSAKAFALPATGNLDRFSKRFVHDQVVQPRLSAATGTYQHGAAVPKDVTCLRRQRH